VINEPHLIDLKIFHDNRGFFCELWRNQEIFNLTGIKDWEQTNWSHSKNGVMRGLHFQKPPFAQAKLILVVHGKIWDVCVDLRKETYGKKYEFELASEKRQILYIPIGFAHGFCVLSKELDLIYRCSKAYNAQSEGGLFWDDPALKINWPTRDVTLSTRDTTWPKLTELKAEFDKISWT
jgi:dTDP-4-dehydrorhamnose 3,5-epimerase